MVSYKRHLLKTISWRAVGTLDTIILSWIITGNWKLGLTIGAVEIITKMILSGTTFHNHLVTTLQTAS